MTKRMYVITSLMILSILFGGVVGCAPASPSTPPAATSTLALLPAPTATLSATALPAGWETHSASANQGQCGYAIDHPSAMEAVSQGTYSWNLNFTTTDPSGPVPNFVYISVIPDELQINEPGMIYNYDPAETQTLLNMQVGDSRSLRDSDPNLAPAFTYTRLPDAMVGAQSAQAYENAQPWEFPAGTKEIRYYLKANACTYLVGGYMSTVDSGQAGAIDEALFDQIIATFRPTS